MKIGGFQKLTLLDYPNQVACIIFTRGCNFRCSFCHNSGLVLPQHSSQLVSVDSVLEYLKLRQGILDAVVITGGEPLLQKDLEYILTKIKDLGYKIKIDTNGSFPDRLQKLIDQKIPDYIAMDIKHIPQKYDLITGASNNIVIPQIESSIKILRNSDISYELRTTLVKGIHTQEDMVELAKWIAGDQPYYLQSYVDSGNVISPEGLQSFSDDELQNILNDVKVYCPNTFIRS